MDTDGLLDPSYRLFLSEPSSTWTLATLPEIRSRVSSGFKQPTTAHGQSNWITGPSGTALVRVCLYRPRLAAGHTALPAILYLHGGGFVLGCPEMVDDYLADLADELEAVIVAVDYRLAPEHPFPAALEDCMATLDWMTLQSSALGLDMNRLVIMGHSAGGGLAASLAIALRGNSLHRATGLVMVYPMLDHRTGLSAADADNPTTGRLSWGREANQFCWRCLQGSYGVDDERAPLFSPALALELKGLPPSFICVGALDLFLEEDTDFALKLSRSGVPVEFHLYPGVPHMFDQYPGAVTDQCRKDVAAAVERMFDQ